VSGSRLVRLAGRDIALQPPVDILRDFSCGRSPQSQAVDLQLDPSHAGQLLFRGRAWVAGAFKDVECHDCGSFVRVSVHGAAAVAVSADGGAVCCLETAPGSDRGEVEEVVAGPGVIFALALQGVFCLHASAVRIGEGVVAFLGPSGSGKSTLAHGLAAAPSAVVSRVADDITAVEHDGARAVALPHMLQPKLDPGLQPRLSQPERLPLAAAAVLATPDDAGGAPDTVVVEALATAEGVVALMRHTMVAALFPPRLRRSHLEVCAAIAEEMPICTLRYPWHRDVRTEILTALESGLAQGGR
jgi:hypothetical protein